MLHNWIIWYMVHVLYAILCLLWNFFRSFFPSNKYGILKRMNSIGCQEYMLCLRHVDWLLVDILSEVRATMVSSQSKYMPIYKRPTMSDEKWLILTAINLTLTKFIARPFIYFDMGMFVSLNFDQIFHSIYSFQIEWNLLEIESID